MQLSELALACDWSAAALRWRRRAAAAEPRRRRHAAADAKRSIAATAGNVAGQGHARRHARRRTAPIKMSAIRPACASSRTA